MNSDRLHKLLQQADASPAADGPSSSALAASVRRLSRQRRQRTQLVCAGLAIVVTAIALWQRPRFSQVAQDGAPSTNTASPNTASPATHSPTVHSPTVHSLAEQFQKAVATIDSEQQFVDRLLVAERLQQAVARTEESQILLVLPAAEIEQLDRAASAIVLAAERKEQRPQLLAAAREDYNLVVHLFPNTPWAALAQDRLQHIPPHDTP